MNNLNKILFCIFVASSNFTYSSNIKTLKSSAGSSLTFDDKYIAIYSIFHEL